MYSLALMRLSRNANWAFPSHECVLYLKDPIHCLGSRVYGETPLANTVDDSTDVRLHLQTSVVETEVAERFASSIGFRAQKDMRYRLKYASAIDSVGERVLRNPRWQAPDGLNFSYRREGATEWEMVYLADISEALGSSFFPFRPSHGRNTRANDYRVACPTVLDAYIGVVVNVEVPPLNRRKMVATLLSLQSVSFA